MIKSMTGFGRAETIFNETYDICVQIRAVNHRYADYTIKTPRIYNFLDDHLRARLSENISRGKVEAYVTITKIENDTKQVKLNRTLASSYMDCLKELSDFGLKDDISVSTLANFEDIFDLEYREVDEDTLRTAVDEAFDIALKGLLDMRISEGSRLKESIIGHLENLLGHAEAVEERSPQTIADYEERLKKRLCDTLTEIGVTADESRILTEVAIFADKVAVDEETVRLKSHIKAFRETLEEDAPAGKKLDFIVQEMNRETNTIGSKCSDIEVTRHVVEMKSIIEKIREQIQNIE